MSTHNGGIDTTPPRKARIEIIPLIDVIFFLLATFVLFTLSLNKIVNIPLELPRAVVNPDPAADNDTVTIQVSEEGTVYWDREPIDIDQVRTRLIEHRRNNKNARVLLAGDDLALYGTTVQVLDEIRKAGIEQVSLETVHRPTGR
ncbi:MAG: biopolymer transporter ExbD [Opitutaceae bacterium]|jgi:biopolymer transport protein ExbD|nr:biopolymer transporter ExbD [Opitutaceae bacterium]